MSELSNLVPEPPPERIAHAPREPRGSSLMLVAHRGEGADALRLEDRHVADLGAILEPGDLLVLNDTRVLPARLHALRDATGGKVELLFLRPRPGERRALALARTRGTLQAGETVTLPGGAALHIAEVLPAGRVEVTLPDERVGDLVTVLELAGEMPLPPYITRSRRDRGDDEVVEVDRDRYQTVFAREPGAVAAPTAGLHFTPEILATLEVRGIDVGWITLHVGAGTFLPIRTDDPRDHPMESESYTIPHRTASLVQAAKTRGGRVVAVGTTCTRALESAALQHGTPLPPCAGEADLYIYPPFEPRVVDALLTNFHLPDSTPCLLVAALLGAERMRRSYEHALQGDYLFYSYGDAMLIL